MRTFVTLCVLFGASVTAVFMILFRRVYIGGPGYYFMIWNLFLAWIPLGFAFIAYHWQHKKPRLLLAALLWLLFLPNAPYMLTDLIHLQYSSGMHFWYDLLTFLTFAFLGLFLGIYSLSLLHDIVARRFGLVIGWLFVILIMALNGLGIYIGRFLRWNSWDIFLSPQDLLKDVIYQLDNIHALGLSFLLGGMLLAIYLLVTWMQPPGYAFKKLREID